MPTKITKNNIPTPTICVPIPLFIIWLLGSRGLSFSTRLFAGNEDRAIAANVSMIRFTQSICVTFRGESRPVNAPISTIRHAQMLIVIWKRMNLCIFRYKERPQIMALTILLKELSKIVISLASLALDVPSPIERPTCALLRAGASFVPSPVTATTWFCF